MRLYRRVWVPDYSDRGTGTEPVPPSFVRMREYTVSCACANIYRSGHLYYSWQVCALLVVGLRYTAVLSFACCWLAYTCTQIINLAQLLHHFLPYISWIAPARQQCSTFCYIVFILVNACIVASERSGSKFLFALPFIHMCIHAREYKMTLLMDDGYKQHQPVPGPFPLALLVLRQRSPCYASESSYGERVEGQVRGSRAWKGGVDVKTSPFFLRPAGRAEE